MNVISWLRCETYRVQDSMTLCTVICRLCLSFKQKRKSHPILVGWWPLLHPRGPRFVRWAPVQPAKHLFRRTNWAWPWPFPPSASSDIADARPHLSHSRLTLGVCPFGDCPECRLFALNRRNRIATEARGVSGLTAKAGRGDPHEHVATRADARTKELS